MQGLLRVNEVNKILRVLVRARTELLDLLQNKAPALSLVTNLLVLVDDDEQIRLLVAGVQQELLRRKREVVLRRDNEDDDVDLLLTSENAGSVSVVTVQTRGVDEGDVDYAVAKERRLWIAGVRQIDLENLRFVLVLGYDGV